MGYYIQCKHDRHKAKQLYDTGAELVLDPTDFDFSGDYALICVIENGNFDAAGIAYDAAERDEFNDQSDTRPRTWLKMKKEAVRKLNPNVPI